MKLHAWIVREIEINEEQAERLVNRLCGCVEHADIDDIKAQFTEGIESGDYDKGYIPYDFISQDLEEQLPDGELRDYWEHDACKTQDIGL